MQDDFQYGPLARGAYIALLWSTAILGFVAADADWARHYLRWHLLLLVFLGLGLKPFLLRTGLYRFWQGWIAELQQRRNAGHHAACAKIYMTTMREMVAYGDQMPTEILTNMKHVLATAEHASCPTQQSWALRRGLDHAYAQMTELQ